jgi:hypothetical protein
MYPAACAGRLAAIGILAAALSGCASMTVRSYMERGVDFQRYHTYRWNQAEALSTGDPRLDNNEFFDARLRTAIDGELAAKGFAKTTADAADLLVHYHASVTQQVDIRELDPGSRYCEEVDCRPFIYEAGTLFVDLVDARTRTLVWRGWAEGSVEGVIDDQAWMEARVDEAISRILQKLPHRP